MSAVSPDQSSPARSETPLAYRVVRGGLWVAASSYFNVGFGFLANLVLTRMLVPEDFGVFALASFFFSLINIRPKIGIGFAFAQRKETTGELVGTHLVLDISAGLMTLLLAGAAVPVLRAFGYPWEVVWVVVALAGVGISDSIMGTAWVLLEKDLQFGRTSLVSSIAFPLSYAPAFWLALHSGGYWSLVAQNATYALLLLVGLWWTARRRLPHIWRLRWHFDRQVAVGLVRFGRVIGLATIAGMIVGQFDNFLVGSLVGVAALGFYDRAYRIAYWPSLLLTQIVSRAAFYAYARLQDEPERLQRAATMTLWLVTTLALPMALAIFVAAPDLVALLYGERWLSSAIFLRFLVAYSVMRPLLEDASSLFVAVGRPHLTLQVAAIQAASLMILGTPATLVYGAVGTCIAVGVAFIIGLGLTYRYVLWIIAVGFWQTLGFPGVAAMLTLAGYFILVRLVGFDDWPLGVRVLAKLAYALAAYSAATFAIQPRGTAGRTRYVWRLIRGRPEEAALSVGESA